ncbi:MAG: DUF2309 domain-containing protein [Rhabdochlamydiaceae bacterium]
MPTHDCDLKQGSLDIKHLVKEAFKTISPFWPLKNLIAVNPLQGLEDLPIEEALDKGQAYFEQVDIPEHLLSINIETIKWLQTYFDEGQAKITMPFRKEGLYKAWKQLAIYDERIHKRKQENIIFLTNLPSSPEEAISVCLSKLGVSKKDSQLLITLLLTSLTGWASYIKYQSEWAQADNIPPSSSQLDYVAFRLGITCLLWPEAKELINWHHKFSTTSANKSLCQIQEVENRYRSSLLKAIAQQKITHPQNHEAQLVFCIDPRSEPFRKNLEGIGPYQTFGFAGFFGIPASIKDETTGLCHSSCPALLQPKHHLIKKPFDQKAYLKDKKGYKRFRLVKSLYQSLKYNFSTPFALVEALGIFSGIWMGLRTFSPKLAYRMKLQLISLLRQEQRSHLSIDTISLEEKCTYAENALKMVGLTENFAPLIVFCGHGSSTQNNAYSSALDCGACGGHPGGINAQILTTIMNDPAVRKQLSLKGIHIPETVLFLAAQHNTTTDEVKIYGHHEKEEIKKLQLALNKAGLMNQKNRLKKLGHKEGSKKIAEHRAYDWAQVRPEWGLARNAAFIVAPRDLTASIDLEGRCFLHSYDHKQDPEGVYLRTILTAPVIVAQWINMQYLFSTLNNSAYGGGSKITKNITGKMGVMQGNASDLMTGLPLQSVYYNDKEPFHEPQRLMIVVLTEQPILDRIIKNEAILKKLFSNGWIQMYMIDPNDHKTYSLKRDLSWEAVA